jgi:hypothetical protein
LDQILRQSVLDQRKLEQHTEDIAEWSRDDEKKPAYR